MPTNESINSTNSSINVHECTDNSKLIKFCYNFGTCFFKSVQMGEDTKTIAYCLCQKVNSQILISL